MCSGRAWFRDRVGLSLGSSFMMGDEVMIGFGVFGKRLGFEVAVGVGQVFVRVSRSACEFCGRGRDRVS